MQDCTGRVGQAAGLVARSLRPQKTDQRAFATIGVLTHSLAHFRRISFYIKEIVGDLKKQAQVMAEDPQRVDFIRWSASQKPPRNARTFNQSAGFALLKGQNVAFVGQRYCFGGQVAHLPADHSRGPRRSRHGRDQGGPGRPVVMGLRASDDLEGAP